MRRLVLAVALAACPAKARHAVAAACRGRPPLRERLRLHGERLVPALRAVLQRSKFALNSVKALKTGVVLSHYSLDRGLKSS